ncbi:hypothetical protein AB1N83_010871 [Pleurotus pulmonarius]
MRSKLPYYCPSVVKSRLNDSRYHENIQNYVERCPIRLYDIISEEFVTRDKLASHIATSLKNTRYVYEQVIDPAIGALFDTLHRAVTEADPPSISTDGAELLLDILLADEDRKWTLPLSDIIAREFTPNIPFKDHRRAESILRLLIILVFNLAAAPINAVVRNLGKYAILSHRWQAQGQEVTFGDMPDGIAPHSIKRKTGYTKFSRFCEASKGLGYRFVWVDSVCIDKSDRDEEHVSISSMFEWYESSYVCSIHLGATPASKSRNSNAIIQDPWFSRGWTLQELIAPRKLKVYFRDWEPVLPDDKYDLAYIPPEIDFLNVCGDAAAKKNPALREIHHAKLRVGDFRSSTLGLHRAAIAFSLTESRETTKEEDKVYCLFSLLDAPRELTVDYGEGFDRAFYRLLKECLTYSGDRQILTRRGRDSSPYNSLLPASMSLRTPLKSEPVLPEFDPESRFDPEIRFDPDGTITLMVIPYKVTRMEDEFYVEGSVLRLNFDTEYSGSRSKTPALDDLCFALLSTDNEFGVVLVPTGSKKVKAASKKTRTVYTRVGAGHLEDLQAVRPWAKLPRWMCVS